MSLPMLPQSGNVMPTPAKFRHDDGIALRLQVFVLPRDAQGRVAVQRIQGYDGWCLSGETLLLNEAPDDAAMRVVRSWYGTPMQPRLARVLSFPATGGDDDRWYLVLVYEAEAPAKLERTPDCLDLAFHALDEGPKEWAMSHADVWGALGGK
jgi:hypothetical protein